MMENTSQKILTVIGIASLGFGCVACAGMTPQERISRQVERAWEEGNAQYAKTPMMIRVRHNPISCDENLKYEANLYGQFRHVYVVGTEGDLSALDEMALGFPNHGVFQHNFVVTGTPYISACGQQHETLRIVPNEKD